jgi:WD40 repeat protein
MWRSPAAPLTSDVFVRDLLYGSTTLVSVNRNGVMGNGASYSPIISADGRAVLFHSLASDLAPGGFGSGVENLFWRDLWSGTTYALTHYTAPYYINNGYSSALAATMTASGRFAVFGGQSTSWYVWDSQAAALVYTTTAPSGFLSGVWTSADGNRIAYSSGSSPSLYFVDRTTNSTILLGSIRSPSHADPCFSADGRFLAYATTSAKVPADQNGLSDIYLYDCQTGSNVLVSQAFNSTASANGASDSPAISADGRFVAYRSAASNLVPNDNNGVPDIFLWDRTTGATMLMSASLSMNSSADNRSLTPGQRLVRRQSLFIEPDTALQGCDCSRRWSWSRGVDLLAGYSGQVLRSAVQEQLGRADLADVGRQRDHCRDPRIPE